MPSSGAKRTEVDVSDGIADRTLRTTGEGVSQQNAE
jgi:hypothetical protein